MSQKININNKLDLIHDHWNPRIAGKINDHEVRLVKFRGEFKFHKHDDEDEMFVILKGKMILDFQDKQVEVNEGEFIIVPKGKIHKPIADEEVQAMMFVKSTNLNTGDTINEFTKSTLDSI